MVDTVTAPTGYVTVFHDKDTAIAVRNRYRSLGRPADVYGAASKVLAADDKGDGAFEAGGTSDDSLFILVAALMRVE